MPIFEQHLLDCEDHDACHVIVGLLDGSPVWWSHGAAIEHPEHRVNMDHPELVDMRDGSGRRVPWSLWCAQGCAERFGLPAGAVEHAAAHAVAKGLLSPEEAAAAVGSTPERLAAVAATPPPALRAARRGPTGPGGRLQV